MHPMHRAVIQGDLQAMVRMIDQNPSLLEASIGQQEEEEDDEEGCVYTQGSTPLILASRRGHVKVVTWLLQHKADIQACDIHGLTPLHAAATWGHVDIVKLLLSPPSLGGGADREKKDHDGYTPLMVASHNGHSDVVLALLG